MKILITFFLSVILTGSSTLLGQNIYNVRDYKAKGDGINLDHVAINNAIDACSKNAGGTVYFPAGIYLCGSIRLKNNVNLHIDAGAIIKGAPAELNAYDQSEEFEGVAYQDGGHTYFQNSLIYGVGLKNISIFGRGMIDGGGLTAKDHEHLGDPTGGSIGTGDKAIALKLCSNILIRDITMFHCGHFAVIATGCDLMTLDNLTIDTNRDGIDIDCCTNTVVTNCKVNTPNDDAICPKSSFALQRAVITENLIISNCEVSGYLEGTLLDGRRIPAKAGWSNGRIKFGTESNGGFRNCIVANCTFRNCNGFALEEVDGGIMENIIVSNITMQDVSHYPLYITLGQRNRGPEGTKTGSVKNIRITNVFVTNADSLSGIQITGAPGYYVEDITLQNIHITYKGGGSKEQGKRIFPELQKGYPEPFLLGMNPAYGLFARHVKGLKLDNVTFKTLTKDFRPALVFDDISGLEINFLTAETSDGISPAVYTNVNKKVIRFSPVLENAKTTQSTSTKK